MYKTRLASNEIFSLSNKIHREVGRAKDLSAPLYLDRGLEDEGIAVRFSTRTQGKKVSLVQRVYVAL